MSNLIDRQAAIDALWKVHQNRPLDSDRWVITDCLREIDGLPSAQPERPRGEWILVKGSNGKDYHKCSECLHAQDITGVKNYCPVCGADMGGEQDD